MADRWQSWLDRWRAAGLVDDATAAAIRAYEARHAPAAGHRAAYFAFAFGGMLLAAGVLLFVASHWDEMGPGTRFGIVLALVALLHVGGALAAARSAALATTLHAIGTAALGAGVFLSGQIFNLAEHWPGGLMLWALGAALALALLRDWPQVAWTALLLPAWLLSEWVAHARGGPPRLVESACVAVALAGLAVAYLGATGMPRPAAWRATLARIGAVALVPVAAWAGVVAGWQPPERASPATPAVPVVVLAAVLALPVLLGLLLRGTRAWPVPVAMAVAGLVVASGGAGAGERLALHLLYALASVGLVGWGLAEREPLRVNLGVLGFALALGAFYFSSVFDRLGRSIGLIVAGVLLIAGGAGLERARRRLVGRIAGSGP